MNAEPSKAAKRVGPPTVKSVTIGEVRYKAIHWGRKRGFGQNGGYIAAVDPGSREELWTLKVYDVSYDNRREEDVQDVFIQSMKADGRHLIVKDEDDRRYSVNVDSKVVTPL